MQVRWTEEAADDLERIADYLLIHTPDPLPYLVVYKVVGEVVFVVRILHGAQKWP